MCGIWLYIKHCTSVTLCKEVINSFHNVVTRGPDCSIMMHKERNRVHVGFHRLAIMDTTEAGNQPFVTTIDDTTYITICNGELYNWRELAKEFHFEDLLQSSCDTEILPHLIHRVGLEKTCALIDGVFAFCIINQNNKSVLVGRDTFGIRPMFYAICENELILSSVLKGIPPNLQKNAAQFPPSHCCEFSYEGSKPVAKHLRRWNTLLLKANIIENIHYPPEESLDYFAGNIRKLLIDAVRKRLMSDRPICCLLSGGLDSSLITSIVCHLMPGQKVKTFAIGMPGSTDLQYAKKVADFLGTEHQEIIVSKEDMLAEIPNIVWETETYDTTTIRASTGNYLISKYIAENTDCIVVFNGDGSDEMFMSYLYGKNAPTSDDFHREAVHLLENIHYFDVLRSDRSISANGLEARTPFLDKKLVEYVLLKTPIKYRQHPTIEKHILRYAFDCKDKPFLPEDVLWRQKEAFSDGISSQEDSWHTCIQKHVRDLNLRVSADKRKKLKLDESVADETAWYYDMFQNNFEGCETVIPYYWLPKWCGNVKDPSARVLDVYDSKSS